MADREEWGVRSVPLQLVRPPTTNSFGCMTPFLYIFSFPANHGLPLLCWMFSQSVNNRRPDYPRKQLVWMSSTDIDGYGGEWVKWVQVSEWRCPLLFKFRSGENENKKRVTIDSECSPSVQSPFAFFLGKRNRCQWCQNRSTTANKKTSIVTLVFEYCFIWRAHVHTSPLPHFFFFFFALQVQSQLHDMTPLPHANKRSAQPLFP